MSRPNILLVFADQLRASSVGHAGQEPVLTPNLDAFARQGVRLTRAVSNCPLCCPARASMFTGLHPLAHGVVGNDILLREDVPGLAKSLAAEGYHTAYIGKWHLDGPDRSSFTPPGPRRQGFQHWAVCNCSHDYLHAYYFRDTPEPIWVDGYEPDAQTDLAIDYLREAVGRSRPFFLTLSWGPPHCPYDQVPERFRRLYDPGSLPMRANAVDPDPRIVAGYYAHITALDECFGRLLAALDALGLSRDTLVLFTSDHGDMLFSQGHGWKSKPWHESVIVPFLARWPGAIPAGAVEPAPFGLVDLAPTLAAICGTSVEADGAALPHMLLGTEGPRPASTPIAFYLRATNPAPPIWRGVVTATHTYARFREEPWVLFDDGADPYQLRNLAREPSADGLRASLEAELARWLDAMGDRFESGPELAARLGIELDARGVPPCYERPEIREERARRATRGA